MYPFFPKKYESIRYAVLLFASCLFFSCSTFEQDNPFDSAGSNWHRPTLSISASSEAWVDEAVSLHATAYDSNGWISRYVWNIDGVFDETDLPAYAAFFPTAGQKRIIVTAYDNDNVPSENKEISIRIRDKTPVLNVSALYISLGSSYSSQTITIANDGYGSMAWRITSNSTWLSVSPSSGTTSTVASVVTVLANRSLLAAGSFSGILTITAGNDSKTIGVSVTNGKLIQVTTLTITNDLILPVNVYVNDIYSMTVPEESVKMDTISPGSSMVVSWELVRDNIGGYYEGEAMSASFTAVSGPTGNFSYEIDHMIGTTNYFAPVITNKSSTSLIVAVNWGLSSQFKCYGYLPSNSSSIRMGYYHLWSNTNVSIFKYGSNFSGNRRAWDYGDQFTSSDIDENSGEVDLATTVAP